MPSETRLRTQILVVGSGAGGAVTAATLAEQGYEVTLLEEGPDADTARMVTNSPQAIKTLYRHGGLTPILGNRSIAFVEGRCVGGSTEINSGFWHRTPGHCYHRWRADALLDDFDERRMEAYFERLEAELSVTNGFPSPEPKSSAVLRTGAERLGWEVSRVKRCQKDPARNPFDPGAKQSMRQTYIPRALSAGARLLPNAKAWRVLLREGRATGVEVLRTENGQRRLLTVRADHVFVCAGAVQTPALLRRSGIRKNIGENLCIHPMLKVAALFDEDVEGLESPLPLYQVPEFGPTVTIGGSVFTPGFLAMLLSENWGQNREVMSEWNRMALYYTATRGMSRGKVRAVPGLDDSVLVFYRLTEADRRNLSIGLARLGELLFAAGARAIYPSLRSFPVLKSADHCRGFLRTYVPISEMSLSTVHVFSSCPMGENRDFCATDSHGRVYGFRNLYVNDASLVPDSPGVNPQGTTMAIALRNAEAFVERNRRSYKANSHVGKNARVKPDVLVTGAPGWLGTRLVEVLTREDDVGASMEARHIRCLVHPAADPSVVGLLGEHVEIAPGNLRDPASLQDFCRDAEGAVLFHVAGVVHPRMSTREFFEVNVDGTGHLLAAAQEAGVRRVVVVSSNSPIGCNPHRDHLFDENSPYNPYMGYGRSKAQMEALVRGFQAQGKLETVIVRPPWFYGPHQPARQTLFFRMIKEGRFPILGDGEQRRSMAYVDNICQGLILAATRPEANGETYWIADERPYTINEIVSTVEDVLERDFGIPCSKRRLRLPSFVGDVAWLLDYGLQSVGLYHQKIHVLGEMNKTIACSIEKARRELGYAPRYELREGMRRSIEWCLANGIRF